MDARHDGFYARNASLFVLPLLTGYFVWKRRLDHQHCSAGWPWRSSRRACSPTSIPSPRAAHTEVLTALHLPIALWLVVGIAYAGGRWSQVAGRMDFIRFSGELFIYYVLIALGGGVFTAFMAMIFEAIGINVEPFFESWLLPCGAAGAVVVASWLVEAKQSVIENMAPVLTRLFTPLFAAVLLTFLGTLLWTGRGVDIERNVLIAFDLLLVVVLGLLLYSVSARDPQSPPGAFDVVQVVLVVSALLADAVALWAIAARITEFGFTPNRVAALGENVILLVNLAWSAVLYVRFLTRARIVHEPRTVADGLPAGLRRVGGDRRDRLSAVVRVRLTRRAADGPGSDAMNKTHDLAVPGAHGYQVPRLLRTANVLFVDGRRCRGHVFLPAAAESHAGPMWSTSGWRSRLRSSRFSPTGRVVRSS